MNVNAIRIIKSDLKTLEKLENNPNHKLRIEEAKKVAKDLNIDRENLYYTYQIVLEQLNGVEYFELSVLDRFSNEDYYNEIVDLYKKIHPNSHPKENYSKIIQFKSHKFNNNK